MAAPSPTEPAPRDPRLSGNSPGDAGENIRYTAVLDQLSTLTEARTECERDDGDGGRRDGKVGMERRTGQRMDLGDGDAEPTWSQVVRRKSRRESAPRADAEELEPVPSRPDVGGGRKPTRRAAPARDSGSGADRACSNSIPPCGAERGEPWSRAGNVVGIRRPPKMTAVLITRAK
ncbi:hypothetical protein KM043_016107 [Ampulex compressa]|nr:hypothetical protein KM043_016107 [Ampulex compressa]